MSDEKTGTGYGALENLRISIFILGAQDRQAEAAAMIEAMESRHRVISYAPEKTGFFTKFSAARAASEIKPHLIHALGLDGAAASAISIGKGSRTAVALSLSAGDLAQYSARKTVRAAHAADAVVVEAEADADKLRENGVKTDIYVTARPKSGNKESHRFFLGAIEVVYGRIIDADKLPATNIDSDGAALVKIGGCGPGSES